MFVQDSDRQEWISNCVGAAGLLARGGLTAAILCGVLLVVNAWLVEPLADPQASARSQPRNSVLSLRPASDGRSVWTTGHPSRWQQIDLATGSVIESEQIQSNLIDGLQLDADGLHLVYGGLRGEVWIREREAAASTAAILPDALHDQPRFALCPHGGWLVLESAGTLELWTLDGSPRRLVRARIGSAVSALAWNPAGSHVLVVSSEGHLLLYEKESLSLVQTARIPAGSGLRATWSADGQWVLVYGQFGAMQLWSVGAESAAVRSFPRGFQSAAALSRQGDWLAYGDELGRLWLISVRNPAQRHLLGRTDSLASAACFTHEGDRLLIGTQGGELLCWSVPDRTLEWRVSPYAL
uniref:WD40 repeat domain-containing protein n=1 Tax=Schlesneria paludicola TaxID=360056 RepID=A0A7C2P177_9PLAN